MQTRINLITLGVKNVLLSRIFYEKGLGWKAASISNEHMVAFQLQNIVLCLYPESLLADDAESSIHSKGFRGITLAHNVSSKKEVDEILKEAIEAGAKLIKPAQDVFWGGYSGYFADPDGHFWEVAWNPHWPLDNGLFQLPS